MKEFKKHDFKRFSSSEELQDALTRKTAYIIFEAVNKDVSIDEFLRMSLKLALIDAVSIGIRPTFLVKDRLEMTLDDVCDFINLAKGEAVEGTTSEELLRMWKEELEEFKGKTEEEIYNVLSHQ